MSNAVEVTIKHPDGVPMRFSKSLIEFLANRQNKVQSFFLGYWLESIADADLKHLCFLVERFIEGGEDSYLDDVLSVAIHTVVAETGNPEVDVSIEQIHDFVGALYLAASFESFRRSGWVELDSTLSIMPNVKVSLRITEIGKQCGDALLQRFH